jgi:hypothetical protein
MKFSYTSNVQQVIKDFQAGKAETKPAVVRALNRTIDQVKVRSAREVRAAGYKLKISDIKNAIRISRASTSRLRADAIASGRPIPLIKYNARQIGAGVSVDVLNGRKVVAHAFVANSANGTPQVLIRKAGAKHKKVVKNGKVRWTALPVQKLFGPAIPDAMGNKVVAQAIIDLITERFPIILEHEHQWLAKRLARKRAVPTD